MFEAFYQLSGPPFRLNPDPRFFFDSRSHQKADSYLHYGLAQAEGFIVITGAVGSGKSTLVSHLLARLDPSRVMAAQIATTQIDADDVIRLIVSAFKLQPASADKATLLRTLEQFLLDQHRQGRHVLLVVDEAQNLPARTIEEIRMLSNFCHDGQSLMQIFLLGQPQFSALLAHPSLEQLRQRVLASYHLETLSAAETRGYIEYRLQQVGWNHDPAISDRAFQRIHDHSGGLPRRINTLCSRLLLYGALEEIHLLDEAEVQAVIADLRQEIAEVGPPASPPGPPPAVVEGVNGRVKRLESISDRHERWLRVMITTLTALNQAGSAGLRPSVDE